MSLRDWHWPWWHPANMPDGEYVLAVHYRGLSHICQELREAGEKMQAQLAAEQQQHTEQLSAIAQRYDEQYKGLQEYADRVAQALVDRTWELEAQREHARQIIQQAHRITEPSQRRCSPDQKGASYAAHTREAVPAAHDGQLGLPNGAPADDSSDPGCDAGLPSGQEHREAPGASAQRGAAPGPYGDW